MSSQDISITLDKRELLGKGLNKLKQAGQIPAVIHRPGEDSVSVSASFIDAVKIYKQAGKHHPVNLTVGSDKYLAIIKSVDIEPTKHMLRHVVFGTIEQDEVVETEVPIVFIGEAPALKIALHINEQLDVVQIEALPRDLPDEVTVNVDGLAEIGDRITVADIIVPKGVTILTEAEHPIATVEEPHLQAEEEPAEVTPAEGAVAPVADTVADPESTKETKDLT